VSAEVYSALAVAPYRDDPGGFPADCLFTLFSPGAWAVGITIWSTLGTPLCCSTCYWCRVETMYRDVVLPWNRHVCGR
jgi:hypothetical protein